MFRFAPFALLLLTQGWQLCLPVADDARAEDAASAARRHARVAERRADLHIICHRGAVEFAHENTLEAYQAAFALGADGNEIDIRATQDGVLVCFHDDMLDHLLAAYGDVVDDSWDALQSLPFRNPGWLAEHCRIPTLREVFLLHRDQAGLMHLDVKRPGLAEPISRLLTELDMWDHVVQAPRDFTDSRYQPTPGKASMYLDRSELDAAAITAMLKRPGRRILVENPQGVARALGRTITRPSREPLHRQLAAWAMRAPATKDNVELDVEELLEVLDDADDWAVVARGEAAEAASAARILRRARAADALARSGAATPEVCAALETRVRNRSLHSDWRYCGLDGAAALRALFALRAPRSAEIARFCLWRDDPSVSSVRDPRYKQPPAWTDWRTKTIVFPLLETLPIDGTVAICNDYLSLSDAAARQIGVPQFEAAARTLLDIRPHAATASRLLDHRLGQVRGRAILWCLERVNTPAVAAVLREQRPFAMSYATHPRVRVAMIGDSTMASYPMPPPDRPDLTGWGQVFDEYFFERVQIINHGRSGRSSKSFLREGHWERTLALEPDYLLIQFGHNDGPGKGAHRTTDPNGDFRDFLRQYLREARQHGIQPILVTPMTRRTFVDGKIRSSLGPWVEAIREVGRQEDVPVVDLHTASVRAFNELGDAGSADLSPSAGDRTHFSRKGAMLMAGLVAQSLPTAAPQLAAWLRDPTIERPARSRDSGGNSNRRTR